jgi:hypothetical protein
MLILLRHAGQKPWRHQPQPWRNLDLDFETDLIVGDNSLKTLGHIDFGSGHTPISLVYWLHWWWLIVGGYTVPGILEYRC